MSDIKSYQRLLAVQALYEVSINNRSTEISIDELLFNIIDNADLKKKNKWIKTFANKRNLQWSSV